MTSPDRDRLIFLAVYTTIMCLVTWLCSYELFYIWDLHPEDRPRRATHKPGNDDLELWLLQQQMIQLQIQQQVLFR